MKRAFLLAVLALGVGWLIANASFGQNSNTKATSNQTTSTDVVQIQTEVKRILALEADTRPSRKEVSPTPTLPPSPTPVATPGPPTLKEEANPGVSPLAMEQTGQEIAGVWLTYYDCDTEGYCGVTKSGVNLKKGGTEEKERYAACDPNYWSVGTIETNGIDGTEFTIVGDPNGYEWKCVDTGSAVIGPAHLDVHFDKRVYGEDYLKTVGTNVTIKILP
ncbi:MAG TPA: hypothetical protein VF303_02470 [Candidatus Nanoarchaeia archaeon]